MRLPERDRYPLAGPLAARRRAPSRRRRGGWWPTRSRGSRVEIFKSSLRVRIVHSFVVGVGTNRRGAVVLWSRHAMQSRERDAFEKLPLHFAQILNPNAVRPAGPQTSSRRGQPSGWLQRRGPGRKPGGRPVFWKLCSDRRVRWAWCRCGACGRFGLAPMAERPIEAGNWLCRVASPPGDSGGLPGGSVRGGPWQGCFLR